MASSVSGIVSRSAFAVLSRRFAAKKKNGGDAHRRAGASMSRVLGNIFHSDFERDAIL